MRSTHEELRWCAVLLATLALLAPTAVAQGQDRNDKWGTKVLGALCVPNLYKVSNELYRSGQIQGEGGVRALHNLGIRTIISLRFWHDDRRKLRLPLEKYGMTYHQIPMNAWHPREDSVKEFLRLFAASPKPVLVHCQHGADRTGFMSAVYSILYKKMEPLDAEKELLKGGYGANRIFARLSRRAIDRMNVADLRQAAGLTP